MMRTPCSTDYCIMKLKLSNIRMPLVVRRAFSGTFSYSSAPVWGCGSKAELDWGRCHCSRAMSFLLALAMMAAFCHSVSADLVFTITGESGSSAMTIAGSGSIVSSGSPAGGSNSSFLQVPDGTPSWQGARNNIGDFLAGSWTSSASAGAELPLAGNLRLVGTGSSTFNFTFDHLRFDDDASVGGDDLDVRFDSSQAYPDYPSGITVSLAGSATFTLGDGNTFDDLIPGTYGLDGFGDSGNSRVEFVIMSAIPEPSSLILMGVFAAIGGLRRRRGCHGRRQVIDMGRKAIGV